MQSKRSIIGTVMSAILFFSFTIHNNSDQKVKEYLTVPGPVEFNKTTFSLSWSSHPNANYYKQEYLPAGQKSETYTKMLSVEAVVGDISPRDVAKSKVDELTARKQTDLVTNYKLIENPSTGEVILDFVISSGNIVEWNVYRYTAIKNGATKALALFAYSRRAYGNATTAFLTSLKKDRITDVNTMAAYKLPAIKLKAE